jgi:hypothetical protein
VNILQVLAVIVMCIDIVVLVGAVMLAYFLIKYRREILVWFQYIKRLSNYV